MGLRVAGARLVASCSVSPIVRIARMAQPLQPELSQLIIFAAEELILKEGHDVALPDPSQHHLGEIIAEEVAVPELQVAADPLAQALVQSIDEIGHFPHLGSVLVEPLGQEFRQRPLSREHWHEVEPPTERYIANGFEDRERHQRGADSDTAGQPWPRIEATTTRARRPLVLTGG